MGVSEPVDQKVKDWNNEYEGERDDVETESEWMQEW